MFRIRLAQPAEADWLQIQFAARLGWEKPAGYFHTALEQQAAGALRLLLALQAKEYLGHCKVVWQSDYGAFRAAGIPEIQDLNVRPDYRRRGIASQLLAQAEAQIAERSQYAGIGFGLYADYGAAQRLYIKRGYLPDGRGAQYRGQPVEPGAAYPLDDDLVLYLIKRLGNSSEPARERPSAGSGRQQTQ